MNKTLLDIAKESQKTVRGQHQGDKDIELAIAWINGDISIGQAALAWGGKASNNVYYIRIALAIRKAVEKGLVRTTHHG